MAKRDRVWGILFTDEGIQVLKGPLKPYLSEGKFGCFMYCKSVDMSQPYFQMTAECENKDGSIFKAQIYVPHRFIRAVIAGTDEKKIGFV